MKRVVLTAVMTVVTVILCGYGVFADGRVVYQSEDRPPFTVASEKDGEVYGIGADLSFYRASGNGYYLFLPGTADLTAVRVRYDGELSAYDESSGNLIAPGGTYLCDLSSGSAGLLEYDGENDAYISYPFTVMRGGRLPAVYITLAGGDDALLRINSSKDNVESGTMVMTGSDGRAVYDGELTKIKGHGNTSYEASKKKNTKNSYNINLAEKTELIAGAGKSRKWTLLRIRTWGEYDPTGLSYVTAFDTYNALIGGGGFRMMSEFVDVYIDGEYRGVYILTERPDINGAVEVTDLEKLTDMPSRDVRKVSGGDDPAIKKGIECYSYAVGSSVPEGTDITGGYVLEIRCGHYGECGFKTREGMFVNVKSPEYPTKEMVQYIASYVQEFEDALFSKTGYNTLGRHWSEYADLEGYAAQTLVYSFYLNWEIYRTSTYLTKDAGGVLKFGPAWDFESGPVVMYDKTLFGVRFGYSEKQQYIWFQEAWKKGDYLNMISGMNLRLQNILSEMLGYSSPAEGGSLIRRMDDTAELIKPSQEMNWIRWKQPDTYSKWYGDMYEALENRYDHWFGRLWNPDKYLLGLTAECRFDGGGTWTLTAVPKGKVESDYAVWFRIGEDITKGESFGTGYEITVTEPGRYYSLITGPNNAYCRDAYGKVFSSNYITVVSNVIEVPESAPAEEEAQESGTAAGAEEKGSGGSWMIPAAVIAAAVCGVSAFVIIRKRRSARSGS